jgi:hypothetical protein
MKKIIKIACISACIIILLFLSLPFFVPQTNHNRNVEGQDQVKQATPQIFTSNPLTELVNRIAAVFNRKNPASEKNTVINTTTTYQDANDDLLVDARAATTNNPTTEEAEGFSSQNGGDFPVGESEEEWVIAPQFTPEGTTRGMHEISIKGDAYDNYVHAERSARFTPVAVIQQDKSVPDSKLARIFNPIKRFLGFDDAKTVDTYQWDSDEQAFQLASVSGSENNNKNPRQFDRAAFPDMDIPNLDGVQTEGSQSTEESEADYEKFFSLFSPEDAMDRLAKDIADAKYPEPRSKEDQKKWEETRKSNFHKNLEKIKAANREFFERKMISENLTEVPLEATIKCLGSAMRTSDSCAMNTNETISNEHFSAFAAPFLPTIDETSSKEAKAKNAAKFPQFGPHPMNFKIAPILGQAKNKQALLASVETQIEDLKKNPDDYSPAKETRLSIYKYMLENSSCEESSCYWVANNKQPDELLKETIEMTGRTELLGDPLNRYEKIKEEYINQQKALLKDPTQEENIDKLVEANPPPYVLYTKEDIDQWMEQTDQYRRQHNFKEITLAYTVTATDGNKLREETQGRLPLLTGNNGESIDDTDPTNKDAIYRGTAIADDFKQYSDHLKKIFKEIREEGNREVFHAHMTPVIKKTTEESAARKAEIDAQNDYGTHNRGE